MEDKVKINLESLESYIEKANRLVELLREAKQIIDSLSGSKQYDVEKII